MPRGGGVVRVGFLPKIIAKSTTIQCFFFPSNNNFISVFIFQLSVSMSFLPFFVLFLFYYALLRTLPFFYLTFLVVYTVYIASLVSSRFPYQIDQKFRRPVSTESWRFLHHDINVELEALWCWLCLYRYYVLVVLMWFCEENFISDESVYSSLVAPQSIQKLEILTEVPLIHTGHDVTPGSCSPRDMETLCHCCHPLLALLSRS